MEVAKENMLFQAIGKNIKRYRNNAMINQAHLASQVSLSRTSLVNIEQGKQQPSLALLWKIAEALGVEMKDLVPSRFEVNNASSDLPLPTSPYVTKVEEASYLLSEFKKTVK